ncbi:MAG: peptidylprolyl isomerase [bacterium]
MQKLLNSDFEKAFLSLAHKGARLIVLKELEKKLLFQHYFEEFKIFLNKEEANHEIFLQKFYQNSKINSDEALEIFLKRIGQTKEEFIELLVYQEQVNRLKKAVITVQDINNEFLEDKYKKELALFGLIRIPKESLANEIFYRLRDDKQDFFELAKQFSVGVEAKFGGIVGPTPLNSINPELKNKLLSLKEGETSQPFTLDGKIFIITRLIRIDRISLTPQIEEDIKNELFEKWVELQLSIMHGN